MCSEVHRLLSERVVPFYKSAKQYKIVSIATTANVNNPPLYVATLRESALSVTFSIILNKDHLIPEVVAFFDGRIDWFFLDAEAKGGLLTLPEVAMTYIKRTPCHLYKPNDLTVESVTMRFFSGCQRGMKVLILGAGNLGSKLALRICELGHDVALYSSDAEKARQIVNGLNVIKRSKSSIVTAVDSHAQKVDALLGCTAGQPVIGISEIDAVKAGGFVLDIGNGTIQEEAIGYALSLKLRVYVPTMASHYSAYVDTFLMEKCRPEVAERAERGSLCFVKVGVIGNYGDVLVDNPECVGKIYGVCNGLGDLLYGAEADEVIRKAEEYIADEK